MALSTLFMVYERARPLSTKAATATGTAGAQSQVEIYGAVPGGDAVSPAGVAHRRGVFAMDQAVFGVSQGKS